MFGIFLQEGGRARNKISAFQDTARTTQDDGIAQEIRRGGRGAGVGKPE